jgi:hypothetical protein
MAIMPKQEKVAGRGQFDVIFISELQYTCGLLNKMIKLGVQQPVRP